MSDLVDDERFVAHRDRLLAALAVSTQFVCRSCPPREGAPVVWPVRHRLGQPVTNELDDVPSADRALLSVCDGAYLCFERFEYENDGPTIGHSYALDVLSRRRSAAQTTSFREEYGGSDPWLAQVTVVAAAENGDVYVTSSDDEIGPGGGRPVYWLEHEYLYGGWEPGDVELVAPDLATLVVSTLEDLKPMLDYWRYIDQHGNQYYVDRIQTDEPRT